MPPALNGVTLRDCTLRDGGHVNDFAFGVELIRAVVAGLSQARADIIELGFLKDGPHAPGQTLFTRVAEAERYTTETHSRQGFSLMIRPDWYDIAQLEPCTGRIATVRFAFHPEDLPLTLRQAEVARAAGYQVVLNPVNVMGYAPSDLESLLRALNTFHPQGVCIVDTFGSMLPDDLARIVAAFDAIIHPSIGIGLHLHENLSISLALAHDFLRSMDGRRPTSVDCSILGMGRIPGNLCTELLMEYLNRTRGRAYQLRPVYELISTAIADLKRTTPWGYLPAYAMTAFRHTHRSYAEYLLGKGDLSLVDIADILDRIIEPSDRSHYRETLAEALYRQHTGRS